MKTTFSSLVLLLKVVMMVVFVITTSVTALAASEESEFEVNDPRNTTRNMNAQNSANKLTSQTSISRSQAMNIASDRYEGKVLSILMDNRSNNWRVRMDRDGTVFNVFVNASSGDVNASSD